MFDWAEKGAWKCRSDEEVDFEGRKFRIGFEPLFVDFTQEGAVYITFLLFKWFALGIIAGMYVEINALCRAGFGAFVGKVCVCVSWLLMSNARANRLTNDVCVCVCGCLIFCLFWEAKKEMKRPIFFFFFVVGFGLDLAFSDAVCCTAGCCVLYRRRLCVLWRGLLHSAWLDPPALCGGVFWCWPAVALCVSRLLFSLGFGRVGCCCEWC